ncbi:uncharacterized protein LOC113324889 [Papaver somniferum]|uniref:uncharacterized protein LOC113324889 n=1 Tax=Papaver somniferum TaxID=3469 RepID=UPI000E704197|nr:uncharacterized protein LOC113324889 [Papaver somniferum]
MASVQVKEEESGDQQITETVLSNSKGPRVGLSLRIMIDIFLSSLSVMFLRRSIRWIFGYRRSIWYHITFTCCPTVPERKERRSRIFLDTSKFKVSCIVGIPLNHGWTVDARCNNELSVLVTDLCSQPDLVLEKLNECNVLVTDQCAQPDLVLEKLSEKSHRVDPLTADLLWKDFKKKMQCRPALRNPSVHV